MNPHQRTPAAAGRPRQTGATCVGLVPALVACALAACSDGGSTAGPAAVAQPVQYTDVALLLSSSSNDRQSQYTALINSLKLVNAAGQSVTVFAAQQSAEFLHLNGNIAPLLSARIPQGVYTSATMEVAGATMTCVAQNSSGGLLVSEYGSAAPGATVQLAGPITIGGARANLLLSLEIDRSAIFTSCSSMYLPAGGFAATTAVQPTFTLAPAVLAAQPSNSTNGQASNLAGLVTSVDTAAGRLGVTTEDGRAWSLDTSGSTAYQGVAALSALAPGMPLIVDMAIHPDGSLAANRVAVPDADSTALSTYHGPVIFVDANASVLQLGPALVQGQIRSTTLLYGDAISGWQFDTSAALYQTSSRFTNLANLPFTASFNASNIVPGQNVLVSNHLHYGTAPNIDPAATITLLPQTIDGTVVGIATSGSFTIYTVALAAYDLFPALAVQAAQTSTLLNPSTIYVYADSGTQQVQASAIAPGRVLRFSGLVFNDNGTLRMDCSDVFDGVAL
jgi:hypothetical protein